MPSMGSLSSGQRINLTYPIQMIPVCSTTPTCVGESRAARPSTGISGSPTMRWAMLRRGPRQSSIFMKRPPISVAIQASGMGIEDVHPNKAVLPTAPFRSTANSPALSPRHGRHHAKTSELDYPQTAAEIWRQDQGRSQRQIGRPGLRSHSMNPGRTGEALRRSCERARGCGVKLKYFRIGNRLRFGFLYEPVPLFLGEH